LRSGWHGTAGGGNLVHGGGAAPTAQVARTTTEGGVEMRTATMTAMLTVTTAKAGDVGDDSRGRQRQAGRQGVKWQRKMRDGQEGRRGHSRPVPEGRPMELQ